MYFALVTCSGVSPSTTDDGPGSVGAVNEPRSLQELLDLAMQKRGVKSGRRLAQVAQDHGLVLTHTTVNALKAGTYKSRPTDETVRAIAWLAGVSDAVAFTAAGLRVPGPPFADELPPGVDILPPKKRKAVIELLRVLIEDEEVMANAQHAAPMTTNRPASGGYDVLLHDEDRTELVEAKSHEATPARPGRERMASDAAGPGVKVGQGAGDRADVVLFERGKATSIVEFKRAQHDVIELLRTGIRQGQGYQQTARSVVDRYRAALEENQIADEASQYLAEMAALVVAGEAPSPDWSKLAARKVGKPSRGQQLRDAQDAAGEAPDAPESEE